MNNESGLFALHILFTFLLPPFVIVRNQSQQQSIVEIQKLPCSHDQEYDSGQASHSVGSHRQVAQEPLPKGADERRERNDAERHRKRVSQEDGNNVEQALLPHEAGQRDENWSRATCR